MRAKQENSWSEIIVLFSFVLGNQRFDKPSFATYAKMESPLQSQDDSTELQFIEKIYADDVNVGMLNAQLEIAAEGR